MLSQNPKDWWWSFSERVPFACPSRKVPVGQWMWRMREILKFCQAQHRRSLDLVNYPVPQHWKPPWSMALFPWNLQRSLMDKLWWCVALGSWTWFLTKPGMINMMTLSQLEPYRVFSMRKSYNGFSERREGWRSFRYDNVDEIRFESQCMTQAFADAMKTEQEMEMRRQKAPASQPQQWSAGDDVNNMPADLRELMERMQQTRPGVWAASVGLSLVELFKFRFCSFEMLGTRGLTAFALAVYWHVYKVTDTSHFWVIFRLQAMLDVFCFDTAAAVSGWTGHVHMAGVTPWHYRWSFNRHSGLQWSWLSVTRSKSP